jgi:hypothetical protein
LPLIVVTGKMWSMLREFSDRDDRPTSLLTKVVLAAFLAITGVALVGSLLIGVVGWLNGL